MNINECLADFQIIGNRISKLSFKNDFVAFELTSKAKKKMRLEHQVLSVTQEPDDSYEGILQLDINISIREEKKSVALSFSIEGCFVCGNRISKEGFTKMLCENGLASLYSIARANIAAISSQAFASGGILIPMINVFQYSNEIKQKAAAEKGEK